MDGSNVSVANINGEIVPLIRAGYTAIGSNYEQHHKFHHWAMARKSDFQYLLKEGERVVGEWLYEAHGTRYNLTHDPFVAFDIMSGCVRQLVCDVYRKCHEAGFVTPHVIHYGDAFSIEQMLEVLEPSHHGAIDPVEGAIWRVERKGAVDFLGKYVRPDKVDGKLLSSKSGEPAIYNCVL